jgi:hypothetical protein
MGISHHLSAIIAAMDYALRIVTRLPISEIWDEHGPLALRKERSLSEDDVANLLRSGPLRFVAADVGQRLLWIDPAECYCFWKDSVKLHIAEPEAAITLTDYKGSYCFFASEWNDSSSSTVVLLEKHH